MTTTIPRPTEFYLGRVTATARNYLTQRARYGHGSPITRATAHAYAAAARAAINRGQASLLDVARASGLTARMAAALDAPGDAYDQAVEAEFGGLR